MYLTLMCLEGKETRVVMDQVKRSWSSLCVGIRVQTQAPLQGTNYDRTSSDGSLRRIRLLATILRVVPIASKERSGFSKEVSSPNGNLMVRFCGSTENVRSPDIPVRWLLIPTSCSRLREERTLVCSYQTPSTLNYLCPG
jgi:hypothetical protein